MIRAVGEMDNLIKAVPNGTAFYASFLSVFCNICPFSAMSIVLLGINI